MVYIELHSFSGFENYNGVLNAAKFSLSCVEGKKLAQHTYCNMSSIKEKGIIRCHPERMCLSRMPSGRDLFNSPFESRLRGMRKLTSTKWGH